MKKRKGLKAVAQSLADSFGGRNNDVHGYWGIGKLYKFALSHKVQKIQLDLVSRKLEPSSRHFISMTKKYKEMLERKIQAYGLSLKEIKSAGITVDFEKNADSTEALFLCQVKIVDDKNRIRNGIFKGTCKPHNPRHEYRRRRGLIL